MPGAAVRGRLLLACLAAALLAAVLCASLASAAAKGKASTYRGKTAQGKPIKLTGSATSLTLASFQIRMLCHDGSLYFASVSGFEPTPVRGGRFADTQYGKSDTVTWDGKASAGKVSGRVEVEDRLPSGVHCVSGPVRFVATR
jgi:hypothetical protein